jgi:hypothetical protein
VAADAASLNYLPAYNMLVKNEFSMKRTLKWDGLGLTGN